ncbi:hypothetical protein J6590_070739 [Homalodisca vitripennis]|nr:hypothetical protein J6590_070739 [Homalodisca vitripennis]
MNEQDSSIYPHLYVANTIDLPQEYFTGGFLQQDPVSHLERPEEYVPQLSNMEDHYQQQPSSSTHVFANPMDRHGCMVESVCRLRHHPRPSRETSTLTEEKRSSRRSPLPTPVTTIVRGPTGRGESGHLRGLPRRLPYDRRRPRGVVATDGRRLRSGVQEVRAGHSPPVGLLQRRVPESLPRSVATLRRPAHSTRRPALQHPPTRPQHPPTHPQHPPTRPQHPPKRHAVTKGLNNELFESMRHKMPESASRAASLVSEISSVSTSKRRSPAPFVLGDFVPKHLQGKEVCTKTICAIQTLRNVKRRDRIEAKINIEVATHYEIVKTPSMTINKRFKRINERINAGTRRSVHCSHHNPIRKSKLNCDSTTFKTERGVHLVTETLFKEAKRGAEVNFGLAMKFGHAYRKEMARFMREHQEFFARALKASELFAWMCFGITTDEVFQVNGIMAASYALASTESKNPNICWNYPLATMIRSRPENVAEPPPAGL